MGEEFANDFVADGFGGFQSLKISGVFSADDALEAVGGASARRFLVVIAHGAQNEDALKIDAASLREERKGLQRASVFHATDHVIADAIGVVAGPGVGPLAHFRAVPESA